MATLQSPGVQVTVIDESFYTPAAPGTVPLIFVATAANKSNASKTGTAPGTTVANQGRVWEITSQRDLTDTFGTPKFYTDASGNPVHGGELNEYGLQAAYSLLGVSSRVYVVRADADLAQLEPSATAPTGAPNSGQHWVDTDASLYGINEWDATNKVFVSKTPIVIDDTNIATDADTNNVPLQSIGTKGSYAVVVTADNINSMYYKNNDNVWVLLGSNSDTKLDSTFSSSTWVSSSWQSSWPIVTNSSLNNVIAGQTFYVNGHEITIPGTTSSVAIASAINNTIGNQGVGAKVNSLGKIELYADASATDDSAALTGGSISLSGNALGSLGYTTGTYGAVALSIQPHYQFPQYATGGNATGSIYVKTTTPGRGANWSVKIYSGATNSWSTTVAPIYGSRAEAVKGLDANGGKNIAVGSIFIESNPDHGTGESITSPKQATFKLHRRVATSPTTITGSTDITSITVTTASSFTLSETVPGSSVAQNTATVVISASSGTVTGASLVASISAAGFSYIYAKLNSDGTLTLRHELGGEIFIQEDAVSSFATKLGFTAYNEQTGSGTANLYDKGSYDSGFDYVVSNWKPLSYEAKSSAPYTDPADGTLWYSSALNEIDIMVHDGTTWKGYQNVYPNTSPNGPIISATEPLAETGQSDSTPLVDGDIWVDTSVSEEYGLNVYVFNGSTLKWVKQDVTDQETPDGWLYADARWSTSGQDTEPAAILDLLTSDYLDPDAPDPALYPQGMRLWNIRRSGFNVKKYIVNHIDIDENNGQNKRYISDPMDGSQVGIEPYATARWVSSSPNNDDGSGTFGRHAQRAFVVAKFKAEIDTNQDVRDTDTRLFNLIATPGYPETIANMNNLNLARSYTSFVVGDTPMRLKANATELADWGRNTAGATDNGDKGLVSSNEYMGVFYPSGFTNDNSGNRIVVPASHMMLRTIAISDQQSFQWFAPSGTKRGVVTNATSVGYLDNGEFKVTALPPALRDTLSTIKVNPIATLSGVGLVNFGNYTRASGSSSLDRINVARLIAYLRRQLDILARPFLFEPNDRTTRNEIKQAAESLMLELVGQRALYDFIVVCDETNNTATTIDRSELYMDIAVEPVKAVEFIYIPLRLKNTGEIQAGL